MEEMTFKAYTRDEFLGDMTEHGPGIFWDNDSDVCYIPIQANRDCVLFIADNGAIEKYSYDDLVRTKWQDGKKCAMFRG